MEFKYKFIFDLSEKAVEQSKDFYRRSIWSLAGPSIFHLLIASISAVFLMKIAEGISIDALAAVGAGQRINLSFVVILVGIGAVTTTFVGKAWGEGSKDSAALAVKTCMLIALAIGIAVMGLIWVTIEPVVRFFSLKGQAEILAIAFMKFVAIVSPAQAVFFVLTTAYRAIGDAKTPFIYAGVGHAFSIFLAYALSYGKFGLPNMGMEGLAIGWSLPLVMITVVYLLSWMTGKTQLPAKFTNTPPPIDWNKFFSICIPASVEPIANQITMLIFSAMVASYGINAFAAFGAGINIFVIIVSIGTGFSMAAASVVVRAIGAGDKETAVKSAYYAMHASLIIAVGLSMVFVVFAQPLAFLMVDDAEVAQLIMSLFYVFALIQPLMVVDFVMVGAIRGAGDSGFPMLVAIFTNLFIRLPIAALVLYWQLPVEVMFSVFIVDVVVKALFVIPRFRAKRWADIA